MEVVELQTAPALTLIDLERVRSLTGLSVTRIYEKIARGEFPRQVKDGILSRWVLGEILDWNRARIKERDATPFTPKSEQRKKTFPQREARAA